MLIQTWMKIGRGSIGSEMSVLDSLIVFSCMSLSGQQNIACNKALQAGSKQTQVDQTFNGYEDHQLKLMEKDATTLVGQDSLQTIGGTVWLTKSIVEKKADFGIAKDVVMEINMRLGELILKWKF
jgi:hypothetical protein